MSIKMPTIPREQSPWFTIALDEEMSLEVKCRRPTALDVFNDYPGIDEHGRSRSYRRVSRGVLDWRGVYTDDAESKPVPYSLATLDSLVAYRPELAIWLDLLFDKLYMGIDGDDEKNFRAAMSSATGSQTLAAPEASNESGGTPALPNSNGTPENAAPAVTSTGNLPTSTPTP